MTLSNSEPEKNSLAYLGRPPVTKKELLVALRPAGEAFLAAPGSGSFQGTLPVRTGVHDSKLFSSQSL
jgi:hypothetical protein